MNAELRANKNTIREYMRKKYTDERLSQLLAHAQDGKLSAWSCCCFIGVTTADHELQGINLGSDTFGGHYIRALKASEDDQAEISYIRLASDDDPLRRTRLIPIIRAELRRRTRPLVESAEVSEEVCV